ncbi:hypothetical protein [Acinetobacter sp. WCHAc010034]|uniref:hypothetical protein n=1 Tax=Acinetobacter sp. WCHAc010034 TaxID=1879049 RepID=UPI0013C2BCBD|nr:hypothetical protein [Acinetobacter sp. WCHAc010034]
MLKRLVDIYLTLKFDAEFRSMAAVNAQAAGAGHFAAVNLRLYSRRMALLPGSGKGRLPALLRAASFSLSRLTAQFLNENMKTSGINRNFAYFLSY